MQVSNDSQMVQQMSTLLKLDKRATLPTKEKHLKENMLNDLQHVLKGHSLLLETTGYRIRVGLVLNTDCNWCLLPNGHRGSVCARWWMSYSPQVAGKDSQHVARSGWWCPFVHCKVPYSIWKWGHHPLDRTNERIKNPSSAEDHQENPVLLNHSKNVQFMPI